MSYSKIVRSALPWVWLLAALALAMLIAQRSLLYELSMRGLRDLGYALLLVCVAAGFLHWRWRIGWARGIALCFLLLIGFHIGLGAVVATMLLAAAAFAVGDRLLGSDDADIAVRILVGLALMLGVVGWLLPLPLHLRGVYVAALLMLIGMRWTQLRAALHAMLQPLLRPQLALGGSAVLALLTIGCIALPAALPTAMFDDLAYHLALPSDLASLGYYRMDAQSQVWALSPWGSDVVHGIVQVLAAGEARGAVHLLWLLLALRLLWRILADEGLDARWCWLGLALFASQPLQYMLAHSMQTEMPTQTLLLGLMLLIARVDADASQRRLLAIAAVVGALLAMKVLTVVYMAPLALWFLWRWRSPRLHRLLPAALLMLAVGGSSYVYAYVIAGNPLLPLFNDVFQSPLYAQWRFRDPHYGPGNPLLLPWRLLFETSKMHEGWKGIGGFQWWFAAAALPWLLATARVRVFAWIGLGATVLLCTQIVHLRYLMPALLGLGIAFILLLARTWPRAGAGFVAGLVVLNLTFAQGTSWMLRDGIVLRYLLVTDGAHQHLVDFAPERLLLAPLKQSGQPFMVFGDHDQSRHAELSGRGVIGNGYDPQTAARFAAALAENTRAGWERLFADYGATHALAHRARSDSRYLAALDELGEIAAEINHTRLYRLPPTPVPAVALADAPAVEREIQVRGDEMFEISFRADARCAVTDSGAALATRLFFDDFGWQGARLIDWQACSHNGRMVIGGRQRIKASYDRVRFEISGLVRDGKPQFAIENLDIHLRRDLTTERDAARRLLGRYR
ncbi:MAG: hypothetical protein IPH76_03280 [Xanthomonadales bacterium]|nr:hypothetical protein [Xanthomonadales bacterium]